MQAEIGNGTLANDFLESSIWIFGRNKIFE